MPPSAPGRKPRRGGRDIGWSVWRAHQGMKLNAQRWSRQCRTFLLINLTIIFLWLAVAGFPLPYAVILLWLSETGEHLLLKWPSVSH